MPLGVQTMDLTDTCKLIERCLAMPSVWHGLTSCQCVVALLGLVGLGRYGKHVSYQSAASAVSKRHGGYFNSGQEQAQACWDTEAAIETMSRLVYWQQFNLQAGLLCMLSRACSRASAVHSSLTTITCLQ